MTPLSVIWDRLDGLPAEVGVCAFAEGVRERHPGVLGHPFQRRLLIRRHAQQVGRRSTRRAVRHVVFLHAKLHISLRGSLRLVQDGTGAAGDPGGDAEPDAMRTLTVSEAATLTRTTPKAIRRRMERGTLRSVLGPDQRRRIPLSELERAGLLAPNGASPQGHEGQGHPGASPQGPVAGVLDAGQILARLEALAAENGRLRVLEERAGSLERELEAERDARQRVEQELFASRARVTELDATLAARRHRWWRRSPSPARTGTTAAV